MKFLKHNFTSVVLISVLFLSIFALVLAASVSYNQIQTLKESQRSVIRSYKIYMELEQLNSYASDAETGQRGFLLTRDSSFLHPYYEAIEKVKWSFAKLNLLTADNYASKRSLDTLVFLINQRFNFLDHVLGVSTDFEIATPDTLRTLLLRGKELMRMTLAQIDRMVFNELQVLREREAEHAKDVRLSPFSILFVVLFSVFVFIVAFYKINKDLKGLEKTNNQLMINNQIFDHSEQIADISHWYWDIKENRMTYSVNLFRLLGCSRNEFEPSFENFLKFVHPSDRHLLVENTKKTTEEITPALTYFRVVRKDGELRHFKSIGKLITDNYGSSFSIGINADITEQYRREKIIREKVSDLERTNRQLSAFSHVASHDLQEPLRKVQTFISRIDLKALPENVRDYLSGIKKETVRLQKFISDLLLYSKASKADKTFEVADLNEILENSKRELSHRIEEKNVIINTTRELPVMSVIPFQIQQLFSNILSNSIKYSKPDGDPIIDISSETVNGRDIQNCTGEPDAKYCKITISDNGIGFEPQYSEKIFTLFYRLHGNRDYTGTGIGLAICKIIVENHKGFIIANGRPGEGATFTIYLPEKLNLSAV